MIDGDNTPDTLNARHRNGQVTEVEPHVTHLLAARLVASGSRNLEMAMWVS